jgi:hypothetical protein
MSELALPCLMCGVQLPNVMPHLENQPDDGLAFETHGAYGSTVFDPMDGSFLEITICDECVVKAAESGQVYVGRDRRPVTLDGLLVGWERLDRPYVLWNKGLPGFEENDAVHLWGLEEARELWSSPRIQWLMDLEAMDEWIATHKPSSSESGLDLQGDTSNSVEDSNVRPLAAKDTP